MDWYWYVIIGVGIILIGYLKWAVWNKMKANRQKKTEIKEKDED